MIKSILFCTIVSISNTIIIYGFTLPVGERRESRDLVVVINNQTTSSKITTGVGGGFYKMKDQQVIQITSPNYGVDNYFNGDATVWRFFGTDCGVSAVCPCFQVPSTFKCFGDYLKISDIPFYEQKFCGDVKPYGIYRAVTGYLRIRFRADFAETDQGFLCYVSCTAPGKADPILPDTKCFTNTNGTTGAVTCNNTEPNPGEVLPPPPIPGLPPCTPVGGTRKTEVLNNQQKVNWIPVAGRSNIDN